MGTQAQAQDTFRLTNFAVAAGSLFFTIAAWSAWYMFKPFVPALLIQIWLTGTILFMLKLVCPGYSFSDPPARRGRAPHCLVPGAALCPDRLKPGGPGHDLAVFSPCTA